ncbi:hypothetical protein [Streptomyces sp. NPDC051921]|uniref:hypothetical protein n=1 Tax=Streptomyces sp. NPDC051921 TaxID=3155806 RepID=UPI00343D2312
MTRKHAEFLTQGAVALLLNIAVVSRNPGAAPLEDELRRLSRFLQDSRATARTMPSAALVPLLDLLADEVGTEAFGTGPAEYRDRLARASRATTRRRTSCARRPRSSARAGSVPTRT